MKIAAYRILITVFIISGSGSAEIISQDLPDSLAGYLEIASKNNPGVQQKLLEYQAALQKIPQVGNLTDPELSAGVFLKPMELLNGNQVADFRIMQMFPWFGVLKNAKDEMSLMAKGKFELFRDAKAQVYYDVQKTWYELFRNQEESRISEKNIEILKTIERLAIVKYKSPSSGSLPSQPSGSMSSSISQGSVTGSTSGMQNMSGVQASQGVAPSGNNLSSMQSSQMSTSTGGIGLSDLFRIQIEIIGIESNIALLKNQERTLIARFNSYLNREPSSPVYVDTILKNNPLLFSEVMIQDSILQNNPMLNMLEYEKQSFEARKRMVTGMSYPMVGLGLNYTLINKNSMSSSSMNGADMLMPMVSVTLPIYRKKFTAMKSETDLLKAAAEQNYIATANSLEVELYNASQLYQDALLRAKLYEDQRILASRSLELLLKDFSTSISPLTDVLRLQQQILEYELKLVESDVDLNIASALLQRLMTSADKQ
jgi:outer membrane protein TolC